VPRLTLNRVFVLSLIGLLGGLALLFWLGYSGLQTALLRSAEQARDKDASDIAQSVMGYLNQAPDAVANFESLVDVGLTKPVGLHSLRDGLLAVLTENPDISEATFTFAKSSGYDANGQAIIDPTSAGQVSLFRARLEAGFVHSDTWFQAGHYLATRTHLYMDGRETAPAPPIVTSNPAEQLTFTVPAEKLYMGRLLWSDLHWSGVDAERPLTQRRVSVSVQKAEYPGGRFAGVLRIGLFKDAIDKAVEMPASVDTSTHSVFICDNDGQLIAISGSTHYILSQDDIRVSTDGAPPQVLDALKRPILQTVDDDTPDVSDHFVTSGTTYLCTFRNLPDTQSWIVGVVVPRDSYLAPLLEIKGRVFWGSVALVVVITLLGLIVLHAVSRAHSVILHEAALMNDFVLTPSRNSCNFYDINRVLGSLERAKTAMRSMGKYVPIDLVRRLYHREEEPRLGGETTELSVLFTDIQSFTEFAEGRDADTVATRLGAYLDVVASGIQRQKGTIDKFIGDSVMAFWNAPEPVPGHSALACGAALAGRDALENLYRSPAWEGAPRFETRFGLHRCVASVGHFGSPDRFNYTAIGDGINLASRLQGLNKHYGTSIIVSAVLREAAGAGFVFRRLDRVAVKGKTESLDIYELIGEASAGVPARVKIYEQALDDYLEREFERALDLAESQPSDPPSMILAARCRLCLAEPPPPDWDGTYAFETK
jgi:adenylate cyclase